MFTVEKVFSKPDCWKTANAIIIRMLISYLHDRKTDLLLMQFCQKNLWPNLKNLSGGLNLSRGLNMVGSTKNCIKCFKI